MKQLLTLTALFFSLNLLAQDKKQDTTIQIILPLDQYRALIYALDQNIDSKKLSKEIFDLLQKSASIYQPADKPKNKQ